MSILCFDFKRHTVSVNLSQRNNNLACFLPIEVPVAVCVSWQVYYTPEYLTCIARYVALMYVTRSGRRDVHHSKAYLR